MPVKARSGIAVTPVANSVAVGITLTGIGRELAVVLSVRNAVVVVITVTTIADTVVI